MEINIPDFINGLFEIIGGCLYWFNVYKLSKDKSVSGIYWPVQLFFTFWGFWNTLFYSHLDQWMSFWGGIILFLGNFIWVIMAAYYMRKTDG